MIQTKDNSITAAIPEGHELDDLKCMAKPSIAELCSDEGSSLLVFPQSLDEYGDKIGKEHIFAINSENQLVTGNIMGFVGCNDTQVSIRSRFAQQEGDYFLHYMLQKVFAINLFDLKHDSDKESVFDFLIYLFPAFLKQALRQGLYKEYQTRHYNDANVRGRIDIQRHIRQNIPFAGKVAYTTREYAVDNSVTQLVRHTIEYIASHPYRGNILNNDEETKEAVSLINNATPSYNRNDKNRIVNLNKRPINHPYFNEYRDLQRLCLQILRHEELKYGQDEEQIYGVLFDGAWLWEEYLNTVLKNIGFEHPRNKSGRGRKYLFSDLSGVCYPDFYSKEMVLDAKYKSYEDLGKVQTADLYQVITYMHILKLNHGGFVVPVSNSNQSIAKMLNGYGGQISILGMNVDQQCASFSDYIAIMETEELRLQESIRGFVS